MRWREKPTIDRLDKMTAIFSGRSFQHLGRAAPVLLLRDLLSSACVRPAQLGGKHAGREQNTPRYVSSPHANNEQSITEPAFGECPIGSIVHASGGSRQDRQDAKALSRRLLTAARLIEFLCYSSKRLTAECFSPPLSFA